MQNTHLWPAGAHILNQFTGYGENMISLQADVDADADSALNLIRIQRQGEEKKKREKGDIHTVVWVWFMQKNDSYAKLCKKKQKKIATILFCARGKWGRLHKSKRLDVDL